MRAGDQRRAPPTRRQLLAAGARQPADDRRRPGPRGVHAGAVHGAARRRAPRSGTGSPPSTSASRPPPRGHGRARLRGHVLPATVTAAEILASRPGRRVLRQRPRRPGRGRLRGRTRCAACSRPACRCSASASAARSSAGRSACGTYKLRFGHRGVNQPVKDLRTGRVQITSHNHGFAGRCPPAPEGGAWRPVVRHRLRASPGHATSTSTTA